MPFSGAHRHGPFVCVCVSFVALFLTHLVFPLFFKVPSQKWAVLKNRLFLFVFVFQGTLPTNHCNMELDVGAMVPLKGKTPERQVPC